MIGLTRNSAQPTFQASHPLSHPRLLGIYPKISLTELAFVETFRPAGGQTCKGPIDFFSFPVTASRPPSQSLPCRTSGRLASPSLRNGHPGDSSLSVSGHRYIIHLLKRAEIGKPGWGVRARGEALRSRAVCAKPYSPSLPPMPWVRGLVLAGTTNNPWASWTGISTIRAGAPCWVGCTVI